MKISQNLFLEMSRYASLLKVTTRYKVHRKIFLLLLAMFSINGISDIGGLLQFFFTTSGLRAFEVQ